ncbi:hypothetical protein AMECASPLE_026512 [Ameca splendens]|uniref:Uncharacterized protein n=1 Tax=Ameca splendens TaxID=208324 RepID=A0ABV0YSH8_9TELE
MNTTFKQDPNIVNKLANASIKNITECIWIICFPRQKGQPDCKTVCLLLLFKAHNKVMSLRSKKRTHSTNISRSHEAVLSKQQQVSYINTSTIKLAVILPLSAACLFALSVASIDRRNRPLRQTESFGYSFFILAEAAETLLPEVLHANE